MTDHFGPLESSAGVGAPFPFEVGANYHVKLFVSAPTLSGGASELGASLDRVKNDGGVVVRENLSLMSGADRDLREGYVGVYAGGATIATQVGFDNTNTLALGPTSTRRQTWGAVKALYHGR